MGVEVYLHVFFFSALEAGNGLQSPAALAWGNKHLVPTGYEMGGEKKYILPSQGSNPESSVIYSVP
jgi:hypothetical protein